MVTHKFLRQNPLGLIFTLFTVFLFIQCGGSQKDHVPDQTTQEQIVEEILTPIIDETTVPGTTIETTVTTTTETTTETTTDVPTTETIPSTSIETITTVQLPQKVADDVYLENPGMGWYSSYTPLVDQTNTAINLLFPNFYYAGVYWKDIETAPGVYDFSLIDERIQKAIAGGQKYAFIVAVTYHSDNVKVSAPDWVRTSGANGWEYYVQKDPNDPAPTSDDEYVWAPDFSDPFVKERLFALIRKLGEVYNLNPGIENLGIGLFGRVGEWHYANTVRRDLVNDTIPLWQKKVPLPDQITFEEYIDVFKQAFPDTPLSGNNGPELLMTYATSQGMGMKFDCMGDWKAVSNHMDDMYPDRLKIAGTTWMHGPYTSEPCGNMVDWVALGYPVEKTMEFLFKHHISTFNNKVKPVPEQYEPLVKKWLPKLGYRFLLTAMSHADNVQPGDSFPINFTVTNLGNAPRYRKNYVAFQLKDSTGQTVHTQVSSVDVRDWQPGYYTDTTGTYCVPDFGFDIEPNPNPATANPDPACPNWVASHHDHATVFTVPQTLAAGTYDLGFGIVDPLTGNAVIQLANDAVNENGWYYLSKLTIVP